MAPKERKHKRRSRRLNIVYTSDSQQEPDFEGFETDDFTSDDEYIPLGLVSRVIKKKKKRQKVKRLAGAPPSPRAPEPQPGTSRMGADEGSVS